MWEIRNQFSVQNAENPTGMLDSVGMMFDSKEEALSWWNASRLVATPNAVRTLTDPDNNVVKVQFITGGI